MDSYQLQCIKFQEQYANKIEKFEECILKAAKLTHAIADTAEKRCEKAWTAIKSENLPITIIPIPMAEVRLPRAMP